MLSTTALYREKINAPKRSFQVSLYLYINDTLTYLFQDNKIVDIEIQRAGELSKFFGFGVSHKTTIKLLDKERKLNINKGDYFRLEIGLDKSTGVEYKQFPLMYVSEITRDEKTNQLTIITYDILEEFKKHTFNELTLTKPYTIADVVNAIATFLGISANIPSLDVFNTNYADGANLEGTESLYEVLTAAAEATQTIFYMNYNNKLTFRRLATKLDKTISKDIYMELTSGANRKLQTICSATELGDNVSSSLETPGETQYVRDNPFWELRDDIDTLVDNAVSALSNITINEFSCEWRGDPALEPGDRLAYETKDDAVEYTYLINDTLIYNGGLRQKTDWSFKETEETASNPTSLGEVLKQTYARVDKANKQVNILVSEVETNKSNISSLQLNTESISATVESLEATTNSQVETINNLVLKADGITNTLDNRGGNNLLRNSYFYEYENGLLTYWSGPQKVIEKYESKSRNALSLQNGTIKQSVSLTNKKYCCSFKYIKLSEVANAKFIINGNEIILDGSVDSENSVEYVIDLKSDSITIEFVCDTNDGFLIYEPMLNEGESASVFTQNTSESISDTVNIGKGVEVLASNIKNKTRIDADGLRGINTETNELTFYQTTDGIYGKELETESIRSGNLIITTRNGHNFMSGL